MPRIFGRKGHVYLTVGGDAPSRGDAVNLTDWSLSADEPRSVTGPHFGYGKGPGAWLEGPSRPDRWDRSQHCGYCGRTHYVAVGEAVRDDCPTCGAGYPGRARA